MEDKDFTLPIQIALQANQPAIAWGPPGVGKTEMLSQIAAQLGWVFRAPPLGSAAPEDVHGIPVIDESHKAYHLVPASWAVDLSVENIGTKPGLLFFDESSTAPPSVQNAAMRVIHERKVGDKVLGPEVRVAMAANPADTTSGAYDLTAPMANRVWHYDWNMPISCWVNGMRKGFPAPTLFKLDPNWQESVPYWRNMVATFIQTQPHKMVAEPKDDAQRGRGWPSCRSWDMGAKLLAASAPFGADVQTLMVLGCVGEGLAVEFMAWMRNLDLPNPQEVLQKPALIKPPKPHEEYRLYAILAGVMHIIRTNANAYADRSVDPVELWNKGWAVLVHVSKFAEDVVLPFAFDMHEIRPSATTPIPPDGHKILAKLAKDSGIMAGVE